MCLQIVLRRRSWYLHPSYTLYWYCLSCRIIHQFPYNINSQKCVVDNYMCTLCKMIHIACYMQVLKRWYWNALWQLILIVPISMLLECYMIACTHYMWYKLSYNLPSYHKTFQYQCFNTMDITGYGSLSTVVTMCHCTFMIILVVEDGRIVKI